MNADTGYPDCQDPLADGCTLLPEQDDGAHPCGMVRFHNLPMAQWIVENLNGNIPDFGGISTPIICKYAYAKAADKGNSHSFVAGESHAQGSGQHCHSASAPGCVRSHGKGVGGPGSSVQPSAKGSWQSGYPVSAFMNQPESELVDVRRHGKAVCGSGSSTENGVLRGQLSGKGPVRSACNVWVKGLPRDFSKYDLDIIFRQFGPLAESTMLPLQPGDVNSCAMVRFVSPSDAAWVVVNLNCNVPQGLADPIECRFAHNQASKDGGGQQQQGRSEPYDTSGPKGGRVGKAGGKGRVSHSIHAILSHAKKCGVLQGDPTVVGSATSVFIGNLPGDTSELELYKLMSPFGALASPGVTAMRGDDGSCKGCGFADFVEAKSAAAAVKVLNGFQTPEDCQ